jgi:hypothetical protein
LAGPPASTPARVGGQLGVLDVLEPLKGGGIEVEVVVRGDQPVPDRPGAAARVEGAGLGSVAPVREVVEGVLEGDRLGPEKRGGRRHAVVVDALQHHRAYPVRVTFGVLLAEQRAVGRAVETDLIDAERGPQCVHVADVRQHVGRVPGAGRPELAVVRDRRVEVGLAGEHDRRFRTGIARDRLATRRAARIEADDVESVLQRVAESIGVPADPVDAGIPRPAGAEDEGADLVRLIGGRPAGHREADRRAAGIVPVRGDHQGGALGAVAARLPAHRRVGRDGESGRQDRGEQHFHDRRSWSADGDDKSGMTLKTTLGEP